MNYSCKILILFVFLLALNISPIIAQDSAPLFPTDVAVEKGTVYITSKSEKSLIIYRDGERVSSVKFDRPVTGVVITNENIFVTTSYEKGVLHKLSKDDYSIVASVETGMGAKNPVASDDGSTIFVCNQFVNSVSKIDAASMKILGNASAAREPYSAALSIDGSKLYVTNFLPRQASTLDVVAAEVSVINTQTMETISNVELSNGSNALRDVATTKDGRFVLISHNLGRYQVPTSQLQQGWMNTNAMSVIDVQTDQLIGSVLLDKPERGFAGIWGIAVNNDKIFVSHSGVHEITVIDYPKFVEKLDGYKDKENLSIDLRFIYDFNERIAVDGNGPRGVFMDDENFYTITYFSDHLNIIDIKTNELSSVELNPTRKESVENEGERMFNDGTFCFQQWQSCNGCHPGEARTDGMNWDLMNDGVGNAKNCKSMLYSHLTAPTMISGIRPNAEHAVRAGYRLIQFFNITEEDAVKVDEYLKSLRPLPSPLLVDGDLSELAQQGRKVFEDQRCDNCHSGPYFTDLQMHRIGEDVEFEKGWDTPTLIEVWRTAPYLFNGRAATMTEVFEVYKHGVEKKLSKKDLAALVEYVNSL